MSGAAAEVVAIALLLVSLSVAVLRPRGLSEAVGAVPAAAIAIAAGIEPASAAWDRLREIGPTVGFLAAVLLFGRLCSDAGVFGYLGGLAERVSKRSPTRLLAFVVAVAAAVTVTLTLDATVVLLTPVVLATARRLRTSPTPHTYACARLANSGSLLLPVSNLTNLLAFGAAGLSFGRFTALMTLPWLSTCALEWAALRVAFRTELAAGAASTVGDVGDAPSAPRGALFTLTATVALIALASSAGVAPAWPALAGCAALLVPRLTRRTRGTSPHLGRLVAAASPGFCLFVLALAVVVDGVTRHGLAAGLRRILPGGESLIELLAIAVVAAVLANLVNNLPATLALIPLVVGRPGAVLAVLIGVNIGPNATYVGSLATLLWRRLLPAPDKPRARQFHSLGAAVTPGLLVMATVLLWGALKVVGT